jgi:site-specific recombinase XerD
MASVFKRPKSKYWHAGWRSGDGGFHLRHSFTSALANAGVAPELRMKLTGHKSAEIHRGYTHLELETLKDAIKKLPGLT